MTLRAEIPRPTFVDLLELCGDEAMLPLHVLGKPDSVSEGTTDFALVVEAERLPATGWQVLHFYEQLMHVSLETGLREALPALRRPRP